MAECLSRRKRYDAALRPLERLNVLRPRDLRVLGRLVETSEKARELEDAVASAHRAEVLAPPNAGIQHDLGRLHGGLGNVAQSKFNFQRGAAMPGGRKEWRWKHLGHCPQFFESDAQIEAYWRALEAELDEALAEGAVYDWRTLLRHAFAPPFQLPHLNRCCRAVKEKFTELFARSFEGQGLERPARDESREKLRVGFLVTPGHEGGFLRLTREIIERIDGDRFEPVLIYHQRSQKRLATHFRRRDLRRVAFGPDLASAVEQVRAAKCDLIYYWKVGADVWNFLLPMARLATVQCTSWSTHGTSGHRFIDYYVSWDRAEPACAPEHYTEELHLFDGSPLYEPRLPVRSRATRAGLGLPESGAIYYCPHRTAKYHPMFDAYLDDVLSQDASGHAVLLVGKDRRVADRLKERMRRGMRPSSAARLIFLPQQSVDSYYRYLSVASVVLNSPIYAGEITSIDGFLYDVPSVALTGELLVQRYTTAFYEFLGIEGFAQNDQEGYVRQAVRLGTDRDYRRHVVEKIRAGSDRFFDRPETIERWESFVESAVDAPVEASVDAPIVAEVAGG
jgi:predicted O-linked N-acetylglucosamine transferase (SPINDLY family)